MAVRQRTCKKTYDLPSCTEYMSSGIVGYGLSLCRRFSTSLASVSLAQRIAAPLILKRAISPLNTVHPLPISTTRLHMGRPLTKIQRRIHSSHGRLQPHRLGHHLRSPVHAPRQGRSGHGQSPSDHVQFACDPVCGDRRILLDMDYLLPRAHLPQ